MEFTVQQIIERGGFSDFVVYAGAHGLRARKVRTVCVVDTFDVEGWVFGGELLLTSGYLFKDYPEQLGDLIEMADRGGAAALGVKTGRFIDRIPKNVIRIAERLDFPLLGIPFHYAHTDIIRTVIDAVADNRSEGWRALNQNSRVFLNTLLELDTIEEILSLLKNQIHRNLAFLNTSTGKRHIMSDSPEFTQVAQSSPISFLMDHFPHEVIPGRASQPNPSGASAPEGYLWFDRPVPDENDAVLAVYVSKMLRLHLRWEHERQRTERGAAAQFVQDVLYKRFKHASEVQSRARALGWEMQGRRAVVFLGEGAPRASLEPQASPYEAFRYSLNSLQGESVPYAALEDGAAFILKTPQQTWDRMKKNIIESLELINLSIRDGSGVKLVIGVGSPVENVLECYKSFREARRIVMMARENQNAAIPAFWEDMGVYKLLAAIYDTQEARDFQLEHLGKLIEPGGNGSSRDSLLQTLFCVIQHNWQLKPVASAMNLHYNTVKYRYHKIEEILGVDLESRAARMTLSLAMELYIMNRAEA